jgi:antitoxin MazE
LEIIMLVRVKKWGNSASIRIPSSLMTSVALKLDQVVDLSAENGNLVIKPVAKASYNLDDMLAQMSPDTFQDDVDFGPPVGDEVW